MSKKNILLSAILVAALIFSGWLIHYATQSDNRTAQNRRDTPDAFMVNAFYKSYDENGNIHSIIQMAKMQHYANNDQSEFTQPYMIFYDQNNSPWHISSHYGESHSGIAKIHLWEKVMIYQPPNSTNHGMTVLTNSLYIDPTERTADTNEAITIIQPGMVVNSIGLHADLKRSQIELLSKAHILYQPEAQ